MKKIALLFGNNEYLLEKHKLNNAVNDAVSMGDCLTALGFDTYGYSDRSYSQMFDDISKFKEKLDNYEVALIFFAGHGVQIKGENYLIPIDATLTDAESCKYSSINLNYIVESLEKSSISTKIVIVDACRDNPFDSRGIGQTSLAPINAPKGTIIAFSTSPGRVAGDGGGKGNGNFTKSMLQHISTPKIPIEEVFKRTRNTLHIMTDGDQISWEHTSLMGDFYFNNDNKNKDMNIEYNEYALQDFKFMFNSKHDLEDIVGKLKSYDWYVQNPAIERINKLNLEEYTSDEIFVLGRNIYQAACGGSNRAYDWLNRLKTNLENFDIKESVHLLNGISYEIYFNSKGKFRSHLRTNYNCYKFVLQVLDHPAYIESCEFISGHLSNYDKHIINVPVNEEPITVDIKVGTNEDDEKYIDSILIDGMNVFYEEDGYEIYCYSNEKNFTKKIKKVDLENDIKRKIVALSDDVIFNYNDEFTNIIMPYDFMLLRYTN